MGGDAGRQVCAADGCRPQLRASPGVAARAEVQWPRLSCGGSTKVARGGWKVHDMPARLCAAASSVSCPSPPLSPHPHPTHTATPPPHLLAFSSWPWLPACLSSSRWPPARRCRRAWRRWGRRAWRRGGPQGPTRPRAGGSLRRRTCVAGPGVELRGGAGVAVGGGGW